MSTTRLSLGKYICGMTASLIIFLAGGWLILAPFALGYQPYGADWTYQAVNDFAIGIPVAVVALASFVLFFYSLLGSLRAAAVLVSPPPVQQPQQPPAPSHPHPSPPTQRHLPPTLATLS